MRAIRKQLTFGMAVVFLVMVQSAWAYYDPGVQRWINRDPVQEMGFRVARRIRVPVEGHNSHLFVKNSPISGIDGFGLFSFPTGSAGSEYLEALGHCVAIAQSRRKEFEGLAQQGRLRRNSDKWYHCVTSCEMTRTCGPAAASALSEAWEFVYPGASADTEGDQQANKDGRACGDCKEKRSCQECCEARGYRR